MMCGWRTHKDLGEKPRHQKTGAVPVIERKGRRNKRRMGETEARRKRGRERARESVCMREREDERGQERVCVYEREREMEKE